MRASADTPQSNSLRQVVVLSEMTLLEAAVLLRALADGSRTPDAVAVDHLMDEDPTQGHDGALA